MHDVRVRVSFQRKRARVHNVKKDGYKGAGEVWMEFVGEKNVKCLRVLCGRIGWKD